MATEQTYTGSCHCGAVAFEVTAAIEEVMECNCSICSRAGYLLAFVSDAQFKLMRGEDAQTDYMFYKKHIHHNFCKTCGIHAFGHGATQGGGTMYAVNVRCLDGVALDGLKVTRVDGRSA